MFGTIVLTFVITAMGMTILFMLDSGHRKDKDNQQLRRVNDNLREQVSDYRLREQEAREQHAYSRGLHNGRETDTLYRGLLSKYENGEQATVIMHGAEKKKAG